MSCVARLHALGCEISRQILIRNKNYGSGIFKKPKFSTFVSEMADLKLEDQLAHLREKVLEQSQLVRNLKANPVSEFDFKRALAELKLRKKKLEELELKSMPHVAKIDRSKLEEVLKRRFFYDQSFSIYGGVTGQYDYGPMGCALKSNILNLWRRFFCLEEQMLEVDCSILTPEQVLKASGHVDRFADLMVKDVENGECFRLDHLIKTHLEKLTSDKTISAETKAACEDALVKLDGLSKEEMTELMRKYDIKSPITKNNLTDPIEFNLMFSTLIGPTGVNKGFLRPETAQGIFVNFKRLLEFNQGKLPFAVSQIGNSFRNEISPRSGLIRTREFTMAEIEHFCDPANKNHPKFKNIEDTTMTFYSACNQMDGGNAEQLTVGEAVKRGLVANETLGYYMARIQKFLLTIGIKYECLRFRQHLDNEMAHYACDCWDAECLTSYGWVECVGCADRSAFDLTQHMAATGIKLVAEKRLKEPKSVTIMEIVPNKEKIKESYPKLISVIANTLKKLSLEEVQEACKKLEDGNSCSLQVNSKSGEEVTLTSEMVSINEVSRKIHVEEIIPSVVEPSFGISRIMYALLEHNFQVREDDEQRCYFTLPASISPVKCSILPLSNNSEFLPFLEELSRALTNADLAHKVDNSSGSIGRRYARTDELGIPYGITVDFDTLKEPHTVTLRERDSMVQVRILVREAADAVKSLTIGVKKWDDILKEHQLFDQRDAAK